MKLAFPLLSIACFLLLGCSQSRPNISSKPLTVQFTAASAPWLIGVTDCSIGNVINADQRTAEFLDPQSFDLAIRIGQSDNLTSSMFQIGSEDILVIANQNNPVNGLTSEDVLGLFTGRVSTWKQINGSDSPVQVWIFFPGEDIQQIFKHTMLSDSPITSTARMAASPDEMSQVIAEDVNAVGILTKHWKPANVSDIYTVTTVPVLAITPSEPQGAVQQLIACMQKSP